MSFGSYCDVDIAMLMGHKLDKGRILVFSSLFYILNLGSCCDIEILVSIKSHLGYRIGKT